MKCPYCNVTDTKVVDKRESGDLVSTRRRRECLKCSKRFTTYERVEQLTLRIIKKDGTREQFDREKLKRGIIRACEKRPINIEKIDGIVDKIEAKLRKSNNKEIKSRIIGEEVMRRLKTLDKVAYIRFASVYREFADADSFKKEVSMLQKIKN